MPELPIVDDEGKLLPYARFMVLAYTTYPDGEDKFEELLASGLVTQVLMDAGPGDDPPPDLLRLAANNSWLIPALYRGPTPEKILKDAMQADVSAWAAGEILLTTLCVAASHPELDVTLKMTVEVISEFQREHGLVAASESTLWNSWSRFKSVAHFHAVQRAWTGATDLPQEPECYVAWRMADFEGYLACAENYRRLAVAGRFLGFEETWRTPASLELPEPGMGIGELLPELLEVFRRYRA